MSNATLIKKFNAKVKKFLETDGDLTFELDGVEFKLAYDGDYKVFCENVLVAWNDNDREFATVGEWLLRNN